MQPFFEQNPWLLIPLIIVTVEAWSLVKRAALHVIGQRHDQSKRRAS